MGVKHGTLFWTKHVSGISKNKVLRVTSGWHCVSSFRHYATDNSVIRSGHLVLYRQMYEATANASKFMIRHYKNILW
jgi:hypothetical protein